jgi:hypothetical protein
VLNIGGCPYFLAVPNHRHVLWSPIMDFTFFLNILDFLDIPILDSGVVRLALLATGCVVTDT